MREIKFRAWEKREHFYEYDVQQATIANKQQEDFNSYFPFKFDGKIVDDYILEQYTGLKDKNGTDIYEGDIVTGFDIYLDHGAISQVFIENGNTYLSGENLETGGDIVLSNFADQCEVIGNIHENSELLGELR